MPDLDSARAFVERLGYKPGYRFEIPSGQPRPVLLLRARVMDARDPRRQIETSNGAFLDDLDEEALLRCALELARRFELHEVDEWLKLDGQSVRDPHRRSPGS